MAWANTWASVYSVRPLTHDGAPQLISFRVLDGEDIEGWIGMESILFWTSMSLQTPRTTDIKLVNCAEWGTEIKFSKENVRWHLCLSLWKTSFSWQRKEKWKNLESTGSFPSHIFFPSFLLPPQACLYFLFTYSWHTCAHKLNVILYSICNVIINTIINHKPTLHS